MLEVINKCFLHHIGNLKYKKKKTITSILKTKSHKITQKDSFKNNFILF